MKIKLAVVMFLLITSSVCYGAGWDYSAPGEWNVRFAPFDDPALEGVGYSAQKASELKNGYCPNAMANHTQETIIISHSQHGTVGEIRPGKHIFSAGAPSKSICADYIGTYTFTGKETRRTVRLLVDQITAQVGWCAVLQ